MSTSPAKPERRETCLVLCDLIQSQMALEADVVSIYNQKRRLVPKSGLYIDVAIVGDRPFAANSKPVNDPAQPDVLEVQNTAIQELLQIDIFSKNDQARLRRVEIVFALTGVAAQQACEQHAMKIGRIPASFVDLSQGEGAARLNRYALTFNVLRGYQISRTVPTISDWQNPPQLIITNP
jgi:hypothetical protein